jgi:hypothetical protein
MPYLLASIPPIEVFIRKEFLYDFTKDSKNSLRIKTSIGGILANK